MESSDFLTPLRQLSAAADILAKTGPDNMRADASRLLAFFREFEARGIERVGITSNEKLFVETAHAALTLVGRNEFAAAHALLEQARSLLR